MFDVIAEDYALKRSKPWKPLVEFIYDIKEEGINFNGILIDLGCAHGRHFHLFKSICKLVIGIDNSWNFLKIALNNLRNRNDLNEEEINRIHLIQADMVYLPFRENSVENIFSIATFHHVQRESERYFVMHQIYDVLKEDGFLLMTVWRRWQKKFKTYFILDALKRFFIPGYSRKQRERNLFHFGDVHLNWTSSKTRETLLRFYHLFIKREIKKYLNKFKIIKLELKGGPTFKDNFFILAKKR
ncbi:MAG: class I SAM-dependent methyltransferase [Promethearchaeota archaeon]